MPVTFDPNFISDDIAVHSIELVRVLLEQYASPIDITNVSSEYSAALT